MAIRKIWRIHRNYAMTDEIISFLPQDGVRDRKKWERIKNCDLNNLPCQTITSVTVMRTSGTNKNE